MADSQERDTSVEPEAMSQRFSHYRSRSRSHSDASSEEEDLRQSRGQPEQNGGTRHRTDGGLTSHSARNLQFQSDRGLAKNSLAGVLMGAVLMLGLVCTVVNAKQVFTAGQLNSLFMFGLYATSLAMFHLLEFFMTALFHPESVDYSSWIISHSRAFTIAYIVCFCEFWIEWIFLPQLKQYLWWVSLLGFMLVAAGQTLRSVAMWTAGTNFTHIVAERKRSNHRLVTWGVYAFSRHPAYCGWFWWSTGIAVLTANPLCMILYPYASWQFFDTRIEYEEEHLLEFFGADYAAYKKRVPTRIPLIS